MEAWKSRLAEPDSSFPARGSLAHRRTRSWGHYCGLDSSLSSTTGLLALIVFMALPVGYLATCLSLVIGYRNL